MTTPAIEAPLLPAPTESMGKFYFSYINSRRSRFVIGLLAVIFVNLTQVTMPKLMQWIINVFEGAPLPALLQGSTRLGSFRTVFFLLLTTMALQAAGRRLWRLYLAQETPYAGAALRLSSWHRASLIPLERLRAKYSGATLISLGTSDVNSARQLYGWSIVPCSDAIFLTIFSLIGMYTIDPWFTLLAIGSFIWVPLAAYGLAQKEARYFADAQKALALLNEACARAMGTVRLQKLSGSELFWRKGLTEAATAYRDFRAKVIPIGVLLALLIGIAPLLILCVLFGWGIHQVQSGALTVGGFVALQSYSAVLQGPIGNIAPMISDVQKGRASLRRIMELLSERPAAMLENLSTDSYNKQTLGTTPIPNGSTLPMTRIGAPILEIKNLSFAYEGAKSYALQNINISLSKGDKLGVSGRIGSGKSTLLLLNAGLLEGYEGQISLDGIDIKSTPWDKLRTKVGFAPQQPFIFASSVADNLRLDANFDDEELWRWLRVVGLDQEIEQLPNNLNAVLGESGVNLSGGQRQRLALARVLIRRPSLILIDDALSAVDAITEKYVISELTRELNDVTLIWATHRPSSLKLCDHSLVLSV